LNEIYKLNETFVKFKSIKEFYEYFISNFFPNQKKISISTYNNILNLIFISNIDNISLTIFHLKEIEIKLNDIYYLLLNYINNNNKLDLNQNKKWNSKKQENQEINKNDISQKLISDLLSQNEKIQQDIISINQNIISLKNSIDSIQKDKIINNQNIVNTNNNQNEKQIKELEDKIIFLSKENKELKDKLNKEKNKSKNEKPKMEKEEISKPEKNKENKTEEANENKKENILEENKENIIIAKFHITDHKSKVRIMNSGDNNKLELSENFDIYVDDIQIPFSFEHQFSSDGMHYVKYKYKKIEKNSINMSSMFKDCKFLKTLDFSNFDMSNITNMSYMFYSCENFNKLILSKHRTNNLLDTSYMFGGCSILTTLDLSNLNPANVSTMKYMFSFCANLKSIDFSSFNKTKVTDMSGLFYKCSELESLDLSNLNTVNVVNMADMFKFC